MRIEQLTSHNPKEQKPSAKAVSEGERLSVDDRLEAREFSKENSRAARQRLARELINKRFRYRVEVPQLQAEQEATIVAAKERAAAAQAERIDHLESLEHSLAQLKSERDQWVALETEVEQVEARLEQLKAEYWAYFLNRFTHKIDQLESKRNELWQQQNSVPWVNAYEVPIAEERLERERALNQQSTRVEESKIESMLFRNKEALQNLIEDDDWVETSKKKIAKFYEKNLGLKRERTEKPEQRDVAANCRRHNVVLMHGFPIARTSAQTGGNQPSFETYNFLGEERALVMAALEPAIATSSKSLDAGESSKFARQEMYYNTGFILAGGEIMSAYEHDEGTYAHDLDSRFPKYDTRAVSDYQEDITGKIQIALDNKRKNDQPTNHNEISVKHPKIAAIYIHDENNTFGQELADGEVLDMDSLQGESGKRKLKILFGLAKKMGLPVILTKKSGEMISLTESNRLVTLDELLDHPVTYSPEERLSFLE
nr:hypothetical protein [Candidatus Moranbacteria bacterium]